jgi:hypothetical protein
MSNRYRIARLQMSRHSLALVCGSAIATHLTVLGGGFAWLDHAHIEEKLAIEPLGLRLFTHGFAGTGYYRPLTALSLSIDALAGSPFVFHLTTLLWHVLAALAVVFAAEALGLSRRAATIAATFFAVHPASTLVAGAIAFRSEAMVTVALLALVWAHVRNKPAIAAAAIVVGALTKEVAIPLAPLFVLALGEWRQRRRLLLVEGIALAAVVALRTAFAPTWRASFPAMTVGDALGTRLASLTKSAAAIVLPIDRSICDAFPITHLWQPTAIAGAVALGALAWGAWRRRGPALLLAIAVLPSLQLVPVLRWWSPHYVYIAMAFFAMLLAETAERMSTALLAAGLAIFGSISLYDGRRFTDDTHLWTPEVAKQPACREGQFFLGEAARLDKHWEAAAKRYEAALAPRPNVLAYVDRGAALQNLGTVRLEQHRFHEARRAFAEALSGTIDEQRRRELTYNLAAAAFSDGDPAEVVRLLAPEISRPDALPAAVTLDRLARERL